MFSSGLVALAIAFAPFVRAASPEWGQCGGIGWSGDTTCVTGTVCTVLNPYYSQCIPGTSAPTPPATTPTPTPSPPSTSPTTTSGTGTTTAAPPPASTGFVQVSGQKFVLNGKTYPLVGANSYWVGLMGYSTANMNQAFADIAKAGGTTVRTWGFNDVTTANGIYYQLWQNGKATVNTGATGLQNFDNVVAAAKANGIRLIVSLTNNWSDYGGMDVYVSQITGTQNHDFFYTNANVIAAFKSYIQTFVTRYKNEPTILGWELANEPRCKGSTGSSSGTCTTTTITKWASDISAFIKSIDSNHLVAIGDEGFFNDPGNPLYPYQGSEGIDFNANLNISTLDFGTAHLYPESWGQTTDPVGFGTQWISDHAASGKAVNKPIILEEFGVTNNQASTYTSWYSTIISSGLTGDLIWQAGSHFSTGSTPDDGYAIFPDDPVYPIESQHAAAIKARG
ncbi:glycoside hydrolase family 5 protein [Polyporus arcularius HHB13444]|uniref:mannan endo-1,4-beta-mannosidase n=1 Tax=Polyporus arcularius HHB13444 TaxID=1314778 RepID=A0A5C3PLB1_9APHY|nr:glycoside hydrolase family 5 protein [Polyporus arcularius HHB13444]